MVVLTISRELGRTLCIEGPNAACFGDEIRGIWIGRYGELQQRPNTGSSVSIQ